MKRIIDGVTYNTDTSTLLAFSEYERSEYDGGGRSEEWLYQTRGGAYFLHIRIHGAQRSEDGGWEEFTADSCEPQTEEDAQKWLLEGDVVVHNNPFGDPPEAEASADAKPSATIYARVPTTLKDRIEKAAKAENLSTNSWMIRCAERCLAAAKD